MPSAVAATSCSAGSAGDVHRADVDAPAIADHPGYRLTGWQGACPDELLDVVTEVG